MVIRDNFIQSVANMEDALANALNSTLENTATPSGLERLLKLIIKKEIVLEFLLDDFPPVCTVETNSFSNITPIVIPATGTEGPAAPYPSPILVTGLTGAIQKITVTFHNLSHTFPDDIVAMLIGPNGQDTLLMASAGNGFDINNVSLTFDDDAANPLPDEAQITSGTFQPTSYGVFDTFPPPANQPSGNTNLSVYNGTDPNGVWNLFIIDQFAVDVGTMAGGWTLTITSCEENSNSNNDINRVQQVLEGIISQETGQESMVKEVTEDQKAERQKKLEMFKKLKEGKKG